MWLTTLLASPADTGHFETGRLGEEEPTPEAELAAELESVKRERQSLLEAIAKVKESAGAPGAKLATAQRHPRQ